MYSIETIVIISLLMLLIGGIIGLVIGRTSNAPDRKRELENQLSSAKEELTAYQQSVTKHFLETSEKVTELTQSYRDLHEHLAKGALQLASAEVGKELLTAGGTQSTLEELEDTPVEPPKDWAPKTPGSHGMLSEEFGLQDSEDSDSPIPGRAASGPKS